MAEQRKCKSLTLERKVALIKEVEKGGRTKTSIAKEFGIPLSTLSTVLKNKEKVQDGFEQAFSSKRKRCRDSKFPDVEAALLLWLQNARAASLPVSGPILMEKADALALQMGYTDFKCSKGWFERFKKRNNVASKPMHGESGAVDGTAVENWRNHRLAELRSAYPDHDIFNLDEAALFYKMLPNRTFTSRGEACAGAKQRKDRITILFGANAAGDEKLPLLIIGKAQNPRCFRGARLPKEVIYRANKTAWMTAALFEEYVRDLDRKFARNNRKVLLIVDNCPGHGQINNLGAITLEFLPPNMTSVLQPMDQGVIEITRKLYRKSLLRRVLLAFEDGKMYEIDLLGAVHLINEAWQQVHQASIMNCFVHAGFSSSTAVPEPADEFSGCDELCNDVMRLACCGESGSEDLNFEDYALYDGDVPVSGEMSDTEIVESALGSDVPEAHVEDEQPREVPTSSETRRMLGLLRNKVEYSGGQERLMRCIKVLEDAFLLPDVKAKQTAITEFFSLR